MDADTVKTALLTQLGKGTIAGFLLSRKRADHKADQLLRRSDLQRYLDRRKLRSPNGEARVLARRFGLSLKDARAVTRRFVGLTDNGRISIAVALRRRPRRARALGRLG